MVARLGGDEFVILLDNVRDAQEALYVGARISDALALPFEIDGSDVVTGASIGIALSREPFDTTEDLVALPTWPCTNPRPEEEAARNCSTNE